MFERVLARMRRLVREGRYVMTIHGHEAMEDDELTLLDIERCFQMGRIIERQRDQSRGEWKYLVSGSTADRRRVGAVAKIGPTGQLVIVTVYTIEGEAG